MDSQRDPNKRHPQVVLGQGFCLATFLPDKVTHLNLWGAFVQMFQPYALADAQLLTATIHIIPRMRVMNDAARILGITFDEITVLTGYLYHHGPYLGDAIKQLRTLK